MRKLAGRLKPYRLPVALVLMLVFLQALAELYLPTLMADIVNIGVVNGNIPYIWRTGGWMLLVAVFGAFCTVLASYFSARVASGFGRDVRNELFAHVSRFTQREFDRFGTASLITRTTNDISQVQMFLIMMLRMMITAPMMAVGGIIMALIMDAALALVIVAIIPVLALAIFLIMRHGFPLFRKLQSHLDKLNLVQREGLTGVRVIRAFDRTEHERRRFDAANRDLTGTALRVNRLMALMMPTMMLIVNVSSIAIVWYGGIRIDHGRMMVGELMAFIQYSTMILFSLVALSFIFAMLPRASASAERIREVLEQAASIVDPQQHGKKEQVEAGTLEFRNVSFRYPGAEQAALDDISFVARPGQVTAIIGGTGSGKSTLLQLIPRFYDVESGSVLVNGVDVRQMPQRELRAMIGYVPQKAVLFSGTIADNIRFGKEDADEEEVRRAAETAQALDFILQLDGGFEAHISQGGTNLSGGQKQRLSIARALVRRPAIYLFDDSFSALDYRTDARLRRALREETKHATVLIVAQRVSTVMDADQIIVMENGRIAGIGTHEQLLKENSVYREIAASQLSKEVIA
jgi:ATP-binding cassette subfamily B protein